MSTTVVVEANIDDETRAKATQVLDDIGLSLSDALRLMLVHMANEGALPFPEFIPNAETIEAMEEARRGGLKSFATVEELFADLNADD